MHLHSYLAVFSLSFTSAGKGQMNSLQGGGGVGSGMQDDMASISLGKLETLFSYYNVLGTIVHCKLSGFTSGIKS